MADPHTISIARQADRNVIDIFSRLASDNGIDNIKVNAGAAGSFAISTAEEYSADVKTLMEPDLSVIETASIPIRGIDVTFHRGGRGKQIQERSPYYDDIAFQVNEQQCALSQGQRLAVITAIASGLESVEPRRSVASG